MPVVALFKIFGFDVTWRVIARVGMGILLAVILYLSVNAVRNHFKHIKELEQNNEKLSTQLTQTEGQRDRVIEVNQQNSKVSQLETEVRDTQQQIASAERQAAEARAKTYKEIQNVIRNSNTPADEPPVAPVILRTIDSLWNDAPAKN